MICPVCKKAHASELTQAMEVLKCAQHITKKAKSLRDFYTTKERFLKYINAEAIDAVEAKGFLEEFEIVLKDLSLAGNKRSREFFGREDTRIKAQTMKERIIGGRVKRGELRRPKKLCPACYKYHFSSAEIPDECWTRAIKGDITMSYEFNKFLQENNYGRLNLQ